MPYTLVDIANSALLKIGDKPVHSLEDNSPQAAAVRLRLPLVSDIVLSSYPFVCARRWKPLIGDPEEPAIPKHNSVYHLPADCLRVLGVYGVNGLQQYSYQQAGNHIYTSKPAHYVYYVKRFEDGDRLDYEVAELISLYLAADICERFNSDTQKKRLILQEYSLLLSHVRTADSRKSGPSSYGPMDIFDQPAFDLDRPFNVTDTRL
jgi:hypothetical protein